VPLNRPETLTSAVITHIRDAIVRGDIPPGSPLPEQALSAALATSRGTVREALRALSDTGLVEVFPHRGAFVSELTGHAAWEICSFRALLEPYASRLSVEARQGDPEMIAAVQGAYAALHDAAGQGEMFTIVNADMALHSAILSFCEHRVSRSTRERARCLPVDCSVHEVYESDRRARSNPTRRSSPRSRQATRTCGSRVRQPVVRRDEDSSTHGDRAHDEGPPPRPRVANGGGHRDRGPDA